METQSFEHPAGFRGLLQVDGHGGFKSLLENRPPGDGGAGHWAIVASLVATAKLNGVEPLAWLTDVLERVLSGRTKATELERLLPWNRKAERVAAAVHARRSRWSDDACERTRLGSGGPTTLWHGEPWPGSRVGVMTRPAGDCSRRSASRVTSS